MKEIMIALLILFALDACYAQSQCLEAAPSGSKLCYNMQREGQNIADHIQSIDTLVQSTIYQSIEEASKMLASGMDLLKKEVASVKVASPAEAPIEKSTIATLQSQTEAVAKESVKTANKELHDEIKKALTSLLGDATFSNNVINALGFTTSTKRKRRSTPTSSDDDLGNSIDGVVKKALPAVNQTLRNADLKMKVSFHGIFTAFTSSIKQLLGSSIGINIDEVERNMMNMITVAAANLIDSKVEYARKLIALALGDLQKIAGLVEPYKSDAVKMTKIVEPARILLSEAIAKTQSPKHDNALVQRIAAGIAKMKEYYEEIKTIVTS